MKTNWLEEIDRERQAQDKKWGIQNHNPLKWLVIIGEEFGEMCECLNRIDAGGEFWDLEDMRREAVQLAASCLAMLESLDRQGLKSRDWRGLKCQ